MASLDGIMDSTNPKADARLAADIAAAEDMIDPRAAPTDGVLPLVLLGSDATDRLHELSSAAGHDGTPPRGHDAPTSPGVDIVMEYARLSIMADAAHWDKQELGYKSEPSHDAPDSEWTAYAAWKREYSKADAKYRAAFSAAYDFKKANLAALKAALGVE